MRRPGWSYAFGVDPASETHIGDGYHAPRQVTATWTPTGREPTITVTVGITDGKPRVRDIQVSASENGREVRPSDLSRIPLAELAENATRTVLTRYGEPNENGVRKIEFVTETDVGARRAVRNARTSARRRTVTDAGLREVAEVYRAALAERRPPTEAVAEHLGRSHRTASDWIARARDAQYLGASRGPGRAGERIEETQ